MEEQKQAQSGAKQVTAQFATKLPDKYHVPDSVITLDTSMATKELNSV